MVCVPTYKLKNDEVVEKRLDKILTNGNVKNSEITSFFSLPLFAIALDEEK